MGRKIISEKLVNLLQRNDYLFLSKVRSLGIGTVSIQLE